MKNYKNYGVKPIKDYGVQFIGNSDIALLTLTGYNDDRGAIASTLKFGGDSDCYAYIADSKASIGSHYTLTHTFNKWLWIYDDSGFTSKFYAETINIYRAGDYGCIIQLINANKQ